MHIYLNWMYSYNCSGENIYTLCFIIVIIFVWCINFICSLCFLSVSVFLSFQQTVGWNLNGKKALHDHTTLSLHIAFHAFFSVVTLMTFFFVLFLLHYCTTKWRRLKLLQFSILYCSAWCVLVFISSETGICLLLPLFSKIYCLFYFWETFLLPVWLFIHGLRTT